ncbi:unnamed protein product [Rotaria socialis]
MANFGYPTPNYLPQNVAQHEQSSKKSTSRPAQADDIEAVEHKKEDENLREKRFLGAPIISKSSTSGHFGSTSPFFAEIKRCLNLKLDGVPSKNPTLIPMMVEKAAEGIIEEGKQIGKERRAEKIASALREKKDAGMEEVWKQCVYLYTSENFLYESLNSMMKSVGDKEQEKIWKNKVPILGPFCLLLMDNPFKKETNEKNIIYRGANMVAEQIGQYEEMAKDKNSYKSFQVYTSCTRSRKKAKALGNTLFIMEVLTGSVIDLSPYSKYPKEEEELIPPGVCFHVKSAEFDRKKNRYTINLELQKKISKKAAIPVALSTVAKKHIFFAYAKDDESGAPIVKKLKDHFIQRRFRVYHPRQNEDVNTKIADGIEKAAAVLVFPSLALETSKPGLKLLNYADQTKTPIINIKICEDFQPMAWLGAILAPAKSCSTDFDEVIQTMISMGIKTGDLVLERGEKNEPQPIQEYLFQGETNSGNLKASYYQSDKEFPMKFKFLGLKDRKVFGQGDDKDGVFTLAGEYKIENMLGVIEMKKEYVGKPPVTYKGNMLFQELNCTIEGQWKMDDVSDKFVMHLTLPKSYTTHMETMAPPKISRKQGTKVMISYCPCQVDLAQKITKGLIAKGIPAVCPPMNVREMIKTAVQKARVVVPLMSKAYEASNTAKHVLSYVDEAGIPIVPVKAQNPYSQSGWLGVICAGALWTQMTNANEFEKTLDDLIKQLQPYMIDCDNQEEQNNVLVDEEFIEGYYMESGEEIPFDFDMFSLINGYIAGEGEDDVGSFVINGEYYSSSDTEDLKFEFEKQYIEKYSIQYFGIITEEDSVLFFDGRWSRGDLSDIFHLEAPTFEPTESEKFHIMLSYNWSHQQKVKKIANKLKEKKIPIWFDIDGDMKGNINSAMANGVEGAAMIISFNTVAYSKSINCQKEFTYATQLKKTILPVLLENEKSFQDTWLGKAIESLEKVNMENESEFDSSFDVILQHIEKACEEKVKEDDDETEVITRFEGGAVHGEYYERDQSFDMTFDFFSLIEGSVAGQGSSNDIAFTITGDYDNEGNVSFTKQYVGKHAVEYEGILHCDEFGGFKIEGKWYTNNATGDFYVESIDDTNDDTNDDTTSNTS